MSKNASQNVLYEVSEDFNEFTQNSSLYTPNISIIQEIYKKFRNWKEIYFKPIFNLALRFFFELDFSSVFPTFQPKDTSSLIEELVFENIFEFDFIEDLEFDLDIRMPPKRRYTIEIEIINKKKATPKFFLSDFEFYFNDD